MNPSVGSAPLRLTDEEFEWYQRFLIEECGLYFTRSREDQLVKGIAERLAATGLTTAIEYFDLLRHDRQDTEERRALFDLLTVSETTFFRNSSQMSAFVDVIIPELVRRCGARDRRIRIWSAGSSTGEEAYTAAICLLEGVPSPESWQLSVTGTDINRISLEQARAGRYASRAVQAVPPHLLERYFDQDSGLYRVKPVVKSLVQFHSHNLVKDPCELLGLTDFDVVFCRNVTIYFNLDTTKQVIEKIYRSLLPEGYLLIGHAETLWQISNRFRVIDYPQTFFYQRPAPGKRVEVRAEPRPFAPLPVVAARSEPPPGAPSPFAHQRVAPPAVTEAFTRALEAYHRKAYADALEQFAQLSKEQPKLLRAMFMQGLILANQGQYNPAVSMLRQLIERDNLYGEAYYLLGVLHQKLGDLDRAVEALQKAVYVDPKVAMTHYQLGEVFLLQQQSGKAKRAYRNAMAVLEKQPTDQLVVYSEDLTVGLMIKACQQRLESL